MIYPIKPRGHTIWSDIKKGSRDQLSVMPMCLDDMLSEDAEAHALEVIHGELIYRILAIMGNKDCCYAFM